MLRLCSVLLYIMVVSLQVNPKETGAEFVDKIFERIDEAYTKAVDAIPKEIKSDEIKLITDGAKKLAANIRTTTNKILKWQRTLRGKTNDLENLQFQLRNISGTINRAADFHNLRKDDPDFDLIEVLTDGTKRYKSTVEDFVKSLRTKFGSLRSSAEDVTKAFEKASELFNMDMKKATQTQTQNRTDTSGVALILKQ